MAISQELGRFSKVSTLTLLTLVTTACLGQTQDTNPSFYDAPTQADESLNGDGASGPVLESEPKAAPEWNSSTDFRTVCGQYGPERVEECITVTEGETCPLTGPESGQPIVMTKPIVIFKATLIPGKPVCKKY